ncbi:MAG: hypothetical protein DSZ03_05860 [Sulfurimonas sp.]|nr:MAG: hypothetical protein DSZ03_05860 [Sulfurimonas sp.]
MQILSKYHPVCEATASSVEIGVNLEFEAASDACALETLLWLFLPYNAAEREQYEQLLQTLAEVLKQRLRAELAGYRIVDGELELYFYAPSAKTFEPVVAAFMSEYSGYDMGSCKDAKQKFYFDALYPDARQLLQIQNTQTIAQLQEAEDQCEQEREVEHYLLFPTRGNAVRALQKASALEFTCKHEYTDDTGELRHIIVITKSHDVSDAVIHEITEDLFVIAMEEHGRYEGWSTTLVLKK